MIATVLAWLLSMGATCFTPPVDAPVVDPFRAPACTYCAGNRGIEYGTQPGQAVVAAASGTVTYSGAVAGVRYVVVRHGDGRLATYGRLESTVAVVGGLLQQGGLVGAASDRFYFGLRDQGIYIDPAPWLGSWRGRPRLIPSDGSHARPSPPRRMICGASTPPGR